MSEVINLNDTTPAAPSGKKNVKWQAGSPTGTDPVTGLPVKPVSAYTDAPLELQTNGTDNGSQAKLNLKAGSNVTITDDGTGGVTVAAESGMSNPMTTAGDMIVGGSSGTPTRLGKGSDGQILAMVGGAQTWATPGSGGGVVGPAFYQDVVDPVTGAASPACVQSTANTGLAATLSGVTNGNLLVFVVTNESASNSSVSDNHGLTWTKAKEQTGTNYIALWYAVAGSAGSYTITATMTGGNSFHDVIAAEFSNTQAVVDVTASTYNSSSPVTLSANPTTQDLLVSAIAGYHNADVFAANAPWSIRQQINGNDALALASRYARSSGSYSVTWTITGAGADNSPVLLVAFKAATGGSAYSGTDGDTYLNSATGDLYKHESGSWVYKGTLTVSQN